jgi:hypothetical protein
MSAGAESNDSNLWALAKFNLGDTYRLLQTGDHGEGWAPTQYNLGLAKRDIALIRQDRSLMIEARDHFALAAPAYDIAGMSEWSIKAKQHQAEIEQTLNEQRSDPP